MSGVQWLVLRLVVLFVGDGMARRLCSESSSPAAGLRSSLRAQGELLYLLTGAAPLDPGRESRVLSSEVETDGCVTLLALLQFDVGVSSSMAVFFTNFLFCSGTSWLDNGIDAQAVLHFLFFS
jgi:hypothetical protein